MTYTFQKEATPRFVAGSKLCDIYIDYTKQPLALGQLKTLFGEPHYLSENLEQQFSYTILATDETGKTFYLEAYSGATGPSISGANNDMEIAKELVAYIQAATPTDYEYEGYYLDAPCKVMIGVRNGIPYMDEEELILTDEEFSELYQRLY
ncbi:MAG: hypothetical protein IJF07_09065 [Lachnospiraceae bacterium]|nr:hypothetical protein [Lachnospiraceae bacterium]